MQAVVELTLEGPLELRMIEVARVQIKIVSVYRNVRILELDDDLNAITLGPRMESQQRMFVEA